jgi:hypothetical protein
MHKPGFSGPEPTRFGQPSPFRAPLDEKDHVRFAGRKNQNKMPPSQFDIQMRCTRSIEAAFGAMHARRSRAGAHIDV